GHQAEDVTLPAFMPHLAREKRQEVAAVVVISGDCAACDASGRHVVDALCREDASREPRHPATVAAARCDVCAVDETARSCHTSATSLPAVSGDSPRPCPERT